MDGGCAQSGTVCNYKASCWFRVWADYGSYLSEKCYTFIGVTAECLQAKELILLEKKRNKKNLTFDLQLEWEISEEQLLCLILLCINIYQQVDKSLAYSFTV